MKNQSHHLQLSLLCPQMARRPMRITTRGDDRRGTVSRTRVSTIQFVNGFPENEDDLLPIVISDAEKENQADSDVILRRTHSFESDEM